MNETRFQLNDAIELDAGPFKSYLENISNLSNFNTDLMYNAFHTGVSKGDKQKQKKNIARTLKKIQKNITALKDESQHLGKIINRTIKHNRKILNTVSKKALRKKNNEITDDDLKDWKTLYTNIEDNTYHSIESMYNISDDISRKSSVS